MTHLPDLPPLLVRLRLLAGRLVTRLGPRKGAHRAPRGAPRQFCRRPVMPPVPVPDDTWLDGPPILAGRPYAPQNQWREW
jgi:hypothetical protein